MNLNPLGNNKTELRLNNGAVIFFSYKTPVAAQLADGHGFVRTSTKYSVTTSKHINQWLDGVNATSVEQSILDEMLTDGN